MSKFKTFWCIVYMTIPFLPGIFLIYGKKDAYTKYMFVKNMNYLAGMLTDDKNVRFFLDIITSSICSFVTAFIAGSASIFIIILLYFLVFKHFEDSENEKLKFSIEKHANWMMYLSTLYLYYILIEAE